MTCEAVLEGADDVGELITESVLLGRTEDVVARDLFLLAVFTEAELRRRKSTCQ